MQSISLKVPAKMNLVLKIGDKRDDGYHFMKMIMQTVNLFDYITIEKTNSKQITIECDDPSVPVDSKNICFKVAELFFEKTKVENCGINITIEKNIPTNAGLGGGSADGAGVLVGLNVMFETDLSIPNLCSIGVIVGADIPFCIIGGTAIAEGIGEIISPLPSLPSCHIVICKQPVGVNTKEAFKKYDDEVISNSFDFSEAVAAIVIGDIQTICNSLFNTFEEIILLPDTNKIKTIMSEYDCIGSLMSGSGSAIFGIFDSRKKATKCAHQLKSEFKQTFVCELYELGATII